MRGIVKYNRSATFESVTLNSARKDGSTMIHWFYATVAGHRTKLIDIRILAKVANDTWEAEDCGVCGGLPFEIFLQSELMRAAKFCAKHIDVLNIFKGL